MSIEVLIHQISFGESASAGHSVYNNRPYRFSAHSSRKVYGYKSRSRAEGQFHNREWGLQRLRRCSMMLYCREAPAQANSACATHHN